jgi:hypothetical protein
LRIVDCATPRNFAAWPSVSHSGSPLGGRRLAAGLGKLLTALETTQSFRYFKPS